MEFVQDGDVGLMNTGPFSNASQFLLTLRPLPPLNRNYVVIGTVLKGMKVIRKVSKFVLFFSSFFVKKTSAIDFLCLLLRCLDVQETMVENTAETD